MTTSRRQYFVFASLSFGSLLVVWSLLTYTRMISELFLPPPSAIVKALIELFVERNFIRDVGITTFRVLTGFAIAALVAVPTGVLVGLSRRAEAFIEPVLDFIRYTPIPAYVPLFILWFGIGELEKTVLIASSVFFQIVLMVANSVSHTPKPLIDSARTLGVTQSQLVIKVIYPFARPRILDDLRISMGWAWAVLTIAEIVGATSGIGFVIIQSQRLLQTAHVIAAVVVVGVLGLLTDAVFKWLYKVSFPWAPRLENHAGA